MDDFICTFQIEDFLNDEEIEAVVDAAVEAASDGQKPYINLGMSTNEANGQLKFDIFKDF